MDSQKPPILVVDDDKHILEYVSRHLESMFGNEVICFQDPRDALAWAEQNKAALGVIDFRMPNLSGIELVRQLRRLDDYEDVPMMMLTSDTNRDLIPEIFDAGFTDYTIKPIERKELFSRVNMGLQLHESKQTLETEKERLQLLVNEAEAIIREKEQRFRYAIDSTNDGIWDLHLKTNSLFLSNNWFKILGFSEDDLPHSLEFWCSRIHGEDLHIFTSALDALRQGKMDSINCSYRMIHKSGHIIWVTTKGKVQLDSHHSPIRVVGAHRDETETKNTFHQLTHDAFHDALTGLANRALLDERLAHVFLRYKRSSDSQFAVIFVDVDNFKQINDTFGHAIGDQLLIQLANILSSEAREIDTVCRIGGDEFIILLERTSLESDVLQIADRIYNCLSQPLTIAGNAIKLELSMGAAAINNTYESANQLLKNADIALYKAKENGRNQIVMFDDTMQSLDPRKRILLDSLRSALDNEEMEVYYQPIVDLKSKTLSGFEALLRWNHPDMGLISPVDFIPLAERNDTIVELSEFVLKEAIQQLAKWQKEYQRPDLFMCINMVSDQISQPDFLENLHLKCTTNNIKPSDLVLEFSEYCLSQVFKWDSLFLNELKTSGYNIALDDYGESRASIRSLIDYRIDVLKVDRSLTLEVLHDERKRRLFDLMISLSHEVGLKVVIEGIQSSELLTYSEKSKAQYGQGFLFAKPITAMEATDLIVTGINTAKIRAS